MVREKRNYSRSKLDIDVKYSISDLNYKGKSYDISPGGIFINSSDSFKAGGEILLSINMPNGSTSFRLYGFIARSEEAGFGVRFKEPLNALLFQDENKKEADLTSDI